MQAQGPILPNFIIGGAAKAGTTSIFSYLSDHPQVCGSSVKETSFFFKSYTGDFLADRVHYSKYFSHCRSDAKVMIEASTGYLLYSKEVAARIQAMLPNVKLLFILRDPVDRLYSYYNFHVGQLTKDFDTDISFEEYVDRCMLYSSRRQEPAKLMMDERHLKALEIGRYAEYLKEYYRIFPREQIKVMLYEDLKKDIKMFMINLCNFLNIGPGFYDKYMFYRVNVTSTSRIKTLHYVALGVNRKLERYLRQRPKIKRNIVTAYKYLNLRREGYLPISQAARVRLLHYYRKSNTELTELLSDDRCSSWVK